MPAGKLNASAGTVTAVLGAWCTSKPSTLTPEATNPGSSLAGGCEPRARAIKSSIRPWSGAVAALPAATMRIAGGGAALSTLLERFGFDDGDDLVRVRHAVAVGEEEHQSDDKCNSEPRPRRSRKPEDGEEEREHDAQDREDGHEGHFETPR